MVRPRMLRLVDAEPGADYFKPRGIPLAELEEVALSVEEIEALRLEFMEKMDKEDAAKKMGVSRTTFWRVLSGAGGKVADALTKGKAIRIEGGDYEIRGTARGGAGRGRIGGRGAGFGRGHANWQGPIAPVLGAPKQGGFSMRGGRGTGMRRGMGGRGRGIGQGNGGGRNRGMRRKGE